LTSPNQAFDEGFQPKFITKVWVAIGLRTKKIQLNPDPLLEILSTGK